METETESFAKNTTEPSPTRLNILLFRLTTNIVALAGLFSLLLFCVYIVGNFQGFQDSTQEIVLETLGVASIFFAIVSVIGIIESIYFFIVRDTLTIFKNICFLFLMIVCFFAALGFISVSVMLSVLSGGI